MSVLSLARLTGADACSVQRELFEEKFGDSVDVTVELCEAHAAVFDWQWAARYLLGEAGKAGYQKAEGAALAEYEKVKGPAWAGYQKAEGAALAEYEKVEGPAWAGYQKAEGAAWAEYQKAEGAAWAGYERACAGAFATAWNKQEESES